MPTRVLNHLPSEILIRVYGVYLTGAQCWDRSISWASNFKVANFDLSPCLNVIFHVPFGEQISCKSLLHWLTLRTSTAFGPARSSWRKSGVVCSPHLYIYINGNKVCCFPTKNEHFLARIVQFFEGEPGIISALLSDQPTFLEEAVSKHWCSFWTEYDFVCWRKNSLLC